MNMSPYPWHLNFNTRIVLFTTCTEASKKPGRRSFVFPSLWGSWPLAGENFLQAQ